MKKIKLSQKLKVKHKLWYIETKVQIYHNPRPKEFKAEERMQSESHVYTIKK